MSKNVYQVRSSTDDSMLVLYSSELVPWNNEADQSTLISAECVHVSRKDILEKLREFADMSRDDAVKSQYGCNSSIEHTLDEILGDIGIKVDVNNLDDLMTLFYLSMDCFFLYTLTSDMEFKGKCSSYASLLTKVLKNNHFGVYLSGIYFWELMRSQTVEQLLHELSFKYVPVFHKCSECIGRTCKHVCCKNWYIETGLTMGVLEKNRHDELISVKQDQFLNVRRNLKRNSAPPSFELKSTKAARVVVDGPGHSNTKQCHSIQYKKLKTRTYRKRAATSHPPSKLARLTSLKSSRSHATSHLSHCRGQLQTKRSTECLVANVCEIIPSNLSHMTY